MLAATELSALSGYHCVDDLKRSTGSSITAELFNDMKARDRSGVVIGCRGDRVSRDSATEPLLHPRPLDAVGGNGQRRWGRLHDLVTSAARA
jgi:hypothetical protein